MYGALFSVLFLQLFVVVAAPFAARVGYPLVVAVPSGVATTIYPGPVLVVVAAVAGFAVALATPRRYHGIMVIATFVVMLVAILVSMSLCYFCEVVICDPYPVANCGPEVGAWGARVICACNIP